MKNFKLFALVLCLVMLVSSAAMADMTPGTYTGVATGMFDGLTVEVTVSATAIEDNGSERGYIKDMPKEEVRLDKWLWAMRVFKTRTISTDACRKGRISVGAEDAPAAEEAPAEEAPAVTEDESAK